MAKKLKKDKSRLIRFVNNYYNIANILEKVVSGEISAKKALSLADNGIIMDVKVSLLMCKYIEKEEK